MRILAVVLMIIFHIAFVRDMAGQNTEIAQMDSCDFRMDTAYAGYLYREAKAMIESHKYDAAYDRLKSAEQIYLDRVGQTDLLTANVLLNLGAIWQKKGNYNRALEFYGKTLSIRLKHIGDNHKDIAIVYAKLGSVYSDKGDNDKALEHVEKSLKIHLESKSYTHPNLEYTYSLMGVIWINKGQFNKALSFFQKALVSANDAYGNEHYRISIIYEMIGICWNILEEYDKAINNYNNALKVSSTLVGDHNQRIASIYSSLGRVWRMRGNYEKALEKYENALALNLQIHDNDHISTASIYGGLGDVFDDKGDYERALQFFEKEMAIKQEFYGNSHPRLTSSLENIGRCWKNEGDNSRALEYFQKALTIKTKFYGEGHPRLASSYDNIASIWNAHGHYLKAIEFYQKALKTKLNYYGENHPRIASSYYNLGMAQLYIGNHELAGELHLKALGIRLRHLGDKHPDVAKSYIRLANISIKCGNYSKAKQYLENSSVALNFNSRKSTSFNELTDSFVLQEMLLERKNYYSGLRKATNDRSFIDSIYSNYRTLLDLESYIQENFSSSHMKKFYSEKSIPIYEGAIQNILNIDNNDLCYYSLTYMEKFKGRQLSEKMKEQAYSTSFGIPDYLSKQEYDLDIDIANCEKRRYQEKYESENLNDSLIKVCDNKLFELMRERDKLQELFKTQYRNYYKARYSQQVISVKGVKDSLLQPYQALLEYFVGDSSIFTFTILPDTFYVHQIKKDFPLVQWVEDMLHGIYDPYTPGANELEREYSFQQAANLIYNKVFYHVDTLLTDGTDIILIPDGILGYIPFDALLTDSTKSESYLIKDHQISYAYSATLQAEMENMQHDHKTQKKILAFAPSFDHFEATGDTNVLASRYIDVSNMRNWLGPLKYNDDEVLSISQMVPTDVFLDSTATKDQFLQNAGDYSIIHLSTHGKANDKMGDYSFLAFYDPQDSSETWLYNRELYGLDLNADMVVLSACETGIGELQRGEGIISLARGFSYAGAKSIITTLWSVNDRSTQKVMELFYSNLADGMPKDAALRHAKLDYLNQYPHLGKSPYFWAGIIPIGDMSPISFQSILYQTPWIWMSLILLLTLGIWAKRQLL